MASRGLPLIAITTGFEAAQWGNLWEGEALLLPATYSHSVARAGGIGLAVPPDPALIDEPNALLDAVDGILISGGHDVDPATYGHDPQPGLEPTAPARDRVELALIRAALERNIPLLGICRGLQILNVAKGGTLHQHLPDVVGHHEHRRQIGNFEGNWHSVEIRPGSLLAGLYEGAHIDAPSHHHQAIDRVGAGLTVSAVAADGVPEAVEHDGSDFALAVQWHPEIAGPGDMLIQALVDAARTRAHRGLGDLLNFTTPTGGMRR